jgi:hypothetical protein
MKMRHRTKSCGALVQEYRSRQAIRRRAKPTKPNMAFLPPRRLSIQMAIGDNWNDREMLEYGRSADRDAQ